MKNTIDPENCKHFNGCLTACKVQLYASPETIVVYHQDKRIQEFNRFTKKLK